MELHEACRPLAFLLGTWRGAGHGHYPTIESFDYLEEVGFGHVGKPFLSYTQKTRDAQTNEPLHAEMGYLRAVAMNPAGNAEVELVLVQPSGIVELHRGTVIGTQIEFDLDAVHTTRSAKSVTDVARALKVSPNEDGIPVLTYDVSMAAVGQPLTHHLHATLARQPNA